nr:DUF695 domain-containing protein [Bacteroides sp.]
MKETQKGEWWTAPTLGDKGGTVLVTGRRDIAKFRDNPRMNIRVEVTWPYEGAADGMPDKPTSELMENVQDALLEVFDKDPVAVMTGIFTGDGERTWVFYTASTNIFGKKLNQALEPFPLLPITVYCENDPDWGQYDEMAEAEISLD